MYYIFVQELLRQKEMKKFIISVSTAAVYRRSKFSSLSISSPLWLCARSAFTAHREMANGYAGNNEW